MGLAQVKQLHLMLPYRPQLSCCSACARGGDGRRDGGWNKSSPNRSFSFSLFLFFVGVHVQPRTFWFHKSQEK